LTQAGIGPFLVNTHHLVNQVESFIQNSPYRNQVTLVHEPELLGTAGTLIKNLGFFQGEDGLLIHADNYCLADFSMFKQAHKQRPPQCVMTMMTFRTDAPSSCGIVELDDKGIVIGFHEKVANPPGNLANGAVYILSAELLKKMDNELSAAKDFSTEILGQFVGQIYTYQTDEIFMDIGSIPAYEKVSNL
jgi:mannose-1-phosphate guanylyltransferase